MSHFLETLPMLLAMGLAGMPHCAGMCGGFAALAGRGALYTLGRATAYVFLGTLAGRLGEAVGAGSRVLAVAGALLLLAAGLEALGAFKKRGWGLGAGSWGASQPAPRPQSPAPALLLGFLNGLLPCPMVYGFLGMAAATGSVAGGAATMLTLAATSTVPLLACGWFGRRFGRTRPVAGWLMIAMAVLTLYRGLSLAGPIAHHVH